MDTPAPVPQLALELAADEWLNTPSPLTLQALRGRVVMLYAFQMLCPACVSHGLPQATEVSRSFGPDDVAVIGLHSVFEHHEAMTPAALRAFVHEYRLAFPIAIDRPVPGRALPQTMAAYAMQGTPTVVLIDRDGYVRLQHFGVMRDLHLGAVIGQLVARASTGADATGADPTPSAQGCGPDGCAAV